jgi:WD40 repeat protein
VLNPEAPTFDVFLSHNGADKPLVQRVAERLRQADIAPWLDAWQLTPGGHWQPELVAGLQASTACAVFIGSRGLGDWAREELAVAQDRAAKDNSFRIFMVLLPGAPDVFDPSLAFLRTRTWVDLRDGVVNPAGIQDLVCAIRGVARRPPSLPETGEEICPYRGLEVFDEAHAAFFFGREDDTARILEKLRTTRFLAVLGPSGSGKSSLVRAGVLPALRNDAVPGSGDWRIAVMVPGARPLASLAAQLAQLPGAETMQRTVDGLSTDERTLDLAVTLGMAGGGAHGHTVLVVEQFEELFTLCPDEEEKKAFLANLAYAGTIPGGRLVVIIAMRADFYSRCASYPKLRDLMAASQFLVGPLDRDELCRAIEEPARAVGLELEAGLVETILDDVADRPGTLPLLEHVLLEVWRRRRGSMLTVEAYVASGGVEGALAKRANAIYESLTPPQQQVARRVLLRLVQPGEGTEDTRRRAGERELLARPGEEADLGTVVNALADQRLLIAGRDETSGEAVFDLTHEALIRGWPELRDWINEDREALRAQRRLTEAATDWEESGRDEALLFRGARLLTWAEKGTEGLSEREQEFLTASNERRNRERAARRRAVRLVIAGLSAGLVTITAVALFALIQRNRAIDERQLARSRQLAASARAVLPADPELSLLLARESFAIRRTPEGEAVLRQATVNSRMRAVLRDHTGPVRSAAFSHEGRRVVSAGTDGTVRVWEWASGGESVVLEGHRGFVYSAAFSRDGSKVVSGGEDGTVRVWDWASRRELARLSGHAGRVYSVAFHPNGRQVASGGEDGTVRVRDWVSGKELGPARGHNDTVRTVAFSGDGTRLLSGGEDRVLEVRDWPGNVNPVRLGEHRGAVLGATFSPDGTRVVSGGQDGTVQMLESRGGGGATMSRLKGGVYAAAFSPDGRHVVSGGFEGTVRVWKLDGSSEPVALDGHQNIVFASALHPDGHHLVSAGEDGTVRVWEWAGGGDPHPLEGHRKDANAAAFSPDGQNVVSTGDDGTVRVWDWARGAMVKALDPGHRDLAYNVAFSRDGQRVVSAGEDDTVRVWDWTSSAEPVVLSGHGGASNAAAFSRDGTEVVSAGDDGVLRVWDWAHRRVARVLPGHRRTVNDVSFSGDGTRLVSASQDGTMRVWDWAGGKAQRSLPGHVGSVLGADFSGDGRRVVSAGADGTVRVWDWQTGRQQAVLEGHRGAVYDAAFRPDGRWIVSAGADGTVRLWDWKRNHESVVVETGGVAWFRAAFSPDGRRIVSAGQEGVLLVRACEVCGDVDNVLALSSERLTRGLTPGERETYLGERRQ